MLCFYFPTHCSESLWWNQQAHRQTRNHNKSINVDTVNEFKTHIQQDIVCAAYTSWLVDGFIRGVEASKNRS